MGSEANWLVYYDLESYLFDTIGPRFRRVGSISAFDFFCIIIWKANRAKSKVARRLLSKGASSLEEAVRDLSRAISAQPNAKERLALLRLEWSFRLPMSTAILSVFYPDEFTVYDVRVCEVLRDFEKLDNMSRFDDVWAGYLSYRSAVQKAAPPDLSLRDQDRWLWAKSFVQQLQRDIDGGFGADLGDRSE
jgi:hypothetical protein